MATCAACGASGIGPGRVCPQCGAVEGPSLELDIRPKAPAKPAPPKPKVSAPEPAAFELAVDPRDLVQQRSAPGGTPAASPAALPAATRSSGHMNAAAARPSGAMAAATSAASSRAQKYRSLPAPADDLGHDAHVLADVGDPPSSWIVSPVYAWRVLKRQRELRVVLAARRAEAEHAATEVEDALVAFAERARSQADKLQSYAVALEDLQRAEDMLRSRDKVLAAEQDAQRARQAQVDGRVAKLEADLLAARDVERVVATDLAAAQSALAREEAKLKRAEAELRAAQQTETRGTGGATS